MRLIKFAAAAASLACMAPAASAQVDAESLTREAVQRLMANHGDVRDYTLVLEHQDKRVPVYVYRSGDSWQVSTPPDDPMGELLSAGMMWAAMTPTSEEEMEEMLAAGDRMQASYGGTATVNGRQAHVVRGHDPSGEDGLDSLTVYVDAETRQLLRITGSGRMDEDESELLGDDAGMRVSLDLSNYAAHDGLTVPMQMRIRMSLELQMTPAERQMMQMMLPQLLEAARQEGAGMDEGERFALEMFSQMLTRGEMDLPVRVVEVRVNSGRPDWPVDEDGDESR